MKFSLPLVGLCFAMLACHQSSQLDNKENQSVTDSTISFSGSSSAAVENENDTLHTFIRTADIKCKVDHVEKTTYTIEDIVSRHGGFVTLTELRSHIDNAFTTPVSEDSAVETTHFTVTNTMIVRVPNTNLDTTLKDIARLVDYLDYRVIKADDISLQLQANKLAQKRGSKHNTRLAQAIDTKGKKLNEIMTAEESLQDKEAQTDDAALSNKSLQNQVNFSTVQLSLYQRQAVTNQTVATHKTIAAYEPGFGTKVLDALLYGYRILENIFIGLLHLWPLLLFGLVGVVVYRKYFRKAVIHPISGK